MTGPHLSLVGLRSWVYRQALGADWSSVPVAAGEPGALVTSACVSC